MGRLLVLTPAFQFLFQSSSSVLAGRAVVVDESVVKVEVEVAAALVVADAIIASDEESSNVDKIDNDCS